MTTSLRILAWNDPRGYGPLDALGRAFRQCPSHTDVRLSWDIQPLEGFESVSPHDVARQYDLIIMDHPHTIHAAAENCLLPIEDLPNHYIGPSFDSYLWNDQLWAVPIDAACHVSAYRAASVKTPPQTWDALFQQAQRGLRIALPLKGVHSLMALLTLLASNAQPFDARAAEPAPDQAFPPDQVLTDAARLLHRIAHGAAPESLHWNPIDALDALAEDRCDLLPITFGYAQYESPHVQFGPVPTLNPHDAPRPILGGTGLAVSAHTSHPKTALALARFAGSVDIQTNLWPQHQGQPAYRDAWRKLAEHRPFYKNTADQLTAAFVRPRCIAWNDFQSAAGSLINRWLATTAPDVNALAPSLRRLWSQIVVSAQPHPRSAGNPC